ncbi:MAG TPA: hypothetical protein VN540_04565 [Clostridia bacterium]|nr:hypothetical protein [Clostridia bacterium]
MRCSCKVCGTYMVQVEHGLKSGCVCPDCGYACRDCMGSDQPPMSADELRRRADALARESGREED